MFSYTVIGIVFAIFQIGNRRWERPGCFPPGCLPPGCFPSGRLPRAATGVNTPQYALIPGRLFRISCVICFLIQCYDPF